LALLVPMIMIAAACGSSDDDSTEAADGSGSDTDCATEGTVEDDADSELEVNLAEWSVGVASETDPGNIELVANNRGAEAHELVVVRADSVDELTVVDNKVDESALPDGSFIGEIEEFAAGGTCSGTFALEAGNYILFCNIVETEDDGEIESHYEKGMVAMLAVG